MLVEVVNGVHFARVVLIRVVRGVGPVENGPVRVDLVDMDDYVVEPGKVVEHAYQEVA